MNEMPKLESIAAAVFAYVVMRSVFDKVVESTTTSVEIQNNIIINQILK